MAVASSYRSRGPRDCEWLTCQVVFETDSTTSYKTLSRTMGLCEHKQTVLSSAHLFRFDHALVGPEKASGFDLI